MLSTARRPKRCSIVVRGLSTMAAILLLASGAQAQQRGATRDMVIAVTPVNLPERAIAGRTDNAAVFHVQNRSDRRLDLRLACAASDAVAGCTPWRTSLRLEQRQERQVVVRYGAGAPGTGRLTLLVSVGGSTVESVASVDVVAADGASAGGAARQQESTEEPLGSAAGSAPIVTPDGAPMTAPPNTTGNTALFHVQNPGLKQTFNLQCQPRSGTGAITGCSVQSSVFVGSFSDVTVPVTFSTGASGTGNVSLFADNGVDLESGWYAVTVQGPITPGPPVADLLDNDMDRIARGACLTSDAGLLAAFQCGELMSAHAMPGFRALDREHFFTLVYSSGTADPAPNIAVNVRVPSGVALPDSLRLTLRVGMHSRSYSFSAAGLEDEMTRRANIHLPAAEWGLATGVHDYEIDVANVYAGSVQTAPTLTGHVIVVNRSGSIYGAGWGVAGVSRIIPVSENRLLVVEGDGSAAIYQNVATNRWRAPPGSYQDMISRISSVQPNGVTATRYVRILLDRTRIWYRTSDGVQLFVAEPVGDYRKVYARYAYTMIDSVLALTWVDVPPHETPLGAAVTLRFDLRFSNGRLGSVVDPAGRIMDVNVTSGGVSFLDPGFDAGRIVNYRYDASNRVDSIYGRRPLLHGRRQVTAYEYHGTSPYLARALQVDTSSIQYTPAQVRAVGETACAPCATAGPDSAGVVVLNGSLVAPDISHITVNADGAPTRIEDPLGRITNLYYDPVVPLRVEQIRFENGPGSADDRVLEFDHDTLGRRTRAQDVTHSSGDGAFIEFVYGSADAPGSPTKVITPGDSAARNTTLFTYRADGLPETIDSPADGATSILYGAYGQPTRITDGRGKATILGYDAPVPQTCPASGTEFLGNLLSWTTPDGYTTEYSYDAYGNVCEIAPPGVSPTLFVWNPMNWLDSESIETKIYGTASNVTLETTYEYDEDGNRIQRIDPRGVVRTWSYDLLDRLEEETDALSHTDFYEYDAGMRQPGRITRRNGHVIDLRYDLLRRDTLRIEASIPDVDSVRTVYDAAGNDTLVAGPDVILRRMFNPEGTLRSETQRIRFGGVPDTLFTYEYRYGPANQLVYAKLPGGPEVDYSWGPGLLLSTVRFDIAGGEYEISLHHDVLGRDSVIEYGPDVDASFTYTSGGLLNEVQTSDGVGEETYDLNYDPVSGMPELLTVTPNGSSPTTTTWDYDPRGQIKFVQRQGPFGSDTREYEYDGSGNRAWEQHGIDEFLYTYGSLPATDRLLERRNLTQATSSDYEYDEYGNLLKRQDSNGYNLVYIYDGAERLFSGNDKAPLVREFRYDGFGRMYRRFDRPEHDPNASRAIFTSPEGVNVGVVAGLIEQYVIQRPGVDLPLAVVTYGQSGPNAVCFLVAHAGRLIATRQADDDACTAAQLEAASYAGAISDSHTFELERAPSYGLSYFRNRWYDSRTGRFTQEDPLRYAGGENLYAYSGNNPATFTDPFGLCPDPNDIRCSLLEGAFTLLGGTAGFITGGGLGLLEIAGTGGLATPAAVATAASGTAIGAGAGRALGEQLGNLLFREGSSRGDHDRGADLSRLSRGEIRRLQRGGVDPHDIKPEPASRFDLYKNRAGDIFSRLKSGGEPEATGYNINDF